MLYTNGDQKLVRFVGHGNSETRTNVKSSYLLAFRSNRITAKANSKTNTEKQKNMISKTGSRDHRINHQRLKYKESWNESNHIVAVFFFLIR